MSRYAYFHIRHKSTEKTFKESPLAPSARAGVCLRDSVVKGFLTRAFSYSHPYLIAANFSKSRFQCHSERALVASEESRLKLQEILRRQKNAGSSREA